MPSYQQGNTETTHQSPLIGVDLAIDHSSQSQHDGWIERIESIHTLFNASPLAKRTRRAITISQTFAKLRGMNGDHANDVKRLAQILLETKHELFAKDLGEERLLDMSESELLECFNELEQKKFARAGSQEKWESLSEEEKLNIDKDVMSVFLLEEGELAYMNLSEQEQHEADFFVVAHCGMHKDQNAMKGGELN